jgi:hypothetical protein
MSRYLCVGSLFAFVAGAQVYITTGETDRFFAWTIKSHLTAAFLGAMYWGAVALLALSARSRYWASARIGAFGAEVLMPLLLASMLLDFDALNTDRPGFIPAATAWAFLVVYAGLPVVFLAVFFVQRRVTGGNPRQLALMPVWISAALALYAVALVGLGIALFAAPTRADAVWPWPLTAIGGRAIGSFLVATGVVMALGVRERDWERAEAMTLALPVLAALELVALARYGGEVDWSTPTAWVYVAGVVGVFAVGAYGASRVFAVARKAKAVPARPAPSG